MHNIELSLSASLQEFVDDQVTERGYCDGGEFVRDLIRLERDRQLLRDKLREGAVSPND